MQPATRLVEFQFLTSNGPNLTSGCVGLDIALAVKDATLSRSESSACSGEQPHVMNCLAYISHTC